MKENKPGELGYAPAVTLTPGELRAYLYMALNNDRSAEEMLLAYFHGAWQLGRELDQLDHFVLEKYCERVFLQALDQYERKSRKPQKSKPQLLLVWPKHRPRKNAVERAETHLRIAALFRLLRIDDVGHEDAQQRTARAFHVGIKMVERISLDQARLLGEAVRSFAESERDGLLKILEGNK